MQKGLKRFLVLLLVIAGTLSGYMYGLSDSANVLKPTHEAVGVEGIDAKITKKLSTILNLIDRDFLNEYDEEALEEGIYKGFVAGLGDKYSVYFDEKEYKILLEHTQGSFGGVGIQVSADRGEFIEVVSPIKGTPADRAGIKTGDKITAINGEIFLSSQMEEAVKVMRGEPGTEVNLSITRLVNGKNENLEFKIVREIINVDSVISEMLEEGIGYIAITGFQERTATEFIEALEELESRGAKKLVLDLRGNPGGLLDVTLEIADYLLGEADIMSVKYKNRPPYIPKSDKEHNPIPMVTLIDKGSASASEIMAGTLKDNGRSEIIGVTTFGKGVVQQIYDIPEIGKKTGMKLTVGEFFTPKGNKINKVGIAPTIEVILNENVKTIGPSNLKEDTQLQRAIELLKKQ